ncbi:DegV family protein [Caryophanon tenue]|uniref:Fatty acid-binding protein DegV n=1 Tax=Caryophanon tenue TaxID=33978 RepID=A0A1C0YNE8_9BACL|nr:DegV family protein [Caryophanon tenue]OCS88687.1 fatty acid-binding protein DegV [Caryophanon tenue]
MGRIHIVTDSTCDLSNEELEQLNIHVVPLTIQLGSQTYIDRIEIQPEQFLQKMKSEKELPKSSQPAPGKFVELYEALGKDGDQVISIHMTGGMSGTVQSARQAADMANADVTVFDSRYIAWGLAFQLREAARLRDAGASVEEIIARVEHVRQNTRLFVIVDTLENLIKGGRIGKGMGMIGSLLNIKPIATLDEGNLVQVTKVRSHKQVVKYCFEQFQQETAGKTVKAVGISHADGMGTMGQSLKELVEQTGFSSVDVAFTCPTISTHTGPGAVGFIYFAE